MKNIIYILLCFLTPWLYSFALLFNYQFEQIFMGFDLLLWRTVFYSLLASIAIILMMISREKIIGKRKNLICFIAAMQVPVFYILCSIVVLSNLAANHNSMNLFLFFQDGPFLIAFSLVTLSLYFLKWKNII